MYFEHGDYNRALDDFNRAVELADPNDTGNGLYNPSAYAHYGRGRAYFELGDYDLALADFNRAIELNSRFASAYVSRGTVYYNQGKYEPALSDYERAIELNGAFITLLTPKLQDIEEHLQR